MWLKDQTCSRNESQKELVRFRSISARTHQCKFSGSQLVLRDNTEVEERQSVAETPIGAVYAANTQQLKQQVDTRPESFFARARSAIGVILRAWSQ